MCKSWTWTQSLTSEAGFLTGKCSGERHNPSLWSRGLGRTKSGWVPAESCTCYSALSNSVSFPCLGNPWPGAKLNLESEVNRIPEQGQVFNLCKTISLPSVAICDSLGSHIVTYHHCLVIPGISSPDYGCLCPRTSVAAVGEGSLLAAFSYAQWNQCYPLFFLYGSWWESQIQW